MTADKRLPLHILDELYLVILDRKGADPAESRTAKLFSRGVAKIAQKVGEEAVETVIEGIRGDRERLTEESADLLYHLMVLWADQDLEPDAVWEALRMRRDDRKQPKSGQEPKAS